MDKGSVQLGKLLKVLGFIAMTLLLTSCGSLQRFHTNTAEGRAMTQEQRLDTRLVDAIASASLEGVKEALADGADIDLGYDTAGKAVVPLTCTDGYNIRIRPYLIEQGADLDFIPKGGNTYLTGAAYRDDLENCAYYLQHGADIAFQDKDGLTPANSAALSGAENTLALLPEIPPK